MNRIEKILTEFAEYDEVEIVVDEEEINDNLYELAHSFGFNVEIKNKVVVSFYKCKLF